MCLYLDLFILQVEKDCKVMNRYKVIDLRNFVPTKKGDKWVWMVDDSDQFSSCSIKGCSRTIGLQLTSTPSNLCVKGKAEQDSVKSLLMKHGVQVPSSKRSVCFGAGGNHGSRSSDSSFF
ncbi:hypothetical protein QVD17_15587 [Tagetes erecta]|uniref:Uncharacterized protein n=1 Tax=Tagetes erecta TaxID=13708 RepID=A0AAD8KPY7_TARER|nr:hypothetical protein QVD17_15587 [Tagetes erecta]